MYLHKSRKSCTFVNGCVCAENGWNEDEKRRTIYPVIVASASLDKPTSDINEE